MPAGNYERINYFNFRNIIKKMQLLLFTVGILQEHTFSTLLKENLKLYLKESIEMSSPLTIQLFYTRYEQSRR